MIVELTKGYSGADMRMLCAEASMVPIRSISDIKAISAATLRPTNLNDFKESLKKVNIPNTLVVKLTITLYLKVKATVSNKDLGMYLEWNNNYGSFEFNVQDLEN